MSHLGFEVPRDVVLYANRADVVSSNPSNAYMLASLGMNGKQIFKLCSELNEQGTNLRDTNLSKEQLIKYGVKEQQEDLEKRIEQIIKQTEFQQIGKKIVAIYEGDDPMGSYFAYNKGAHICISVNSHTVGDRDGVTFAIQSDPKKCDLPFEVIQWAIKVKREEILKGAPPTSKTGFKNIDDMLIKQTRIICGGNTRPDLFLEDRREEKEKTYKDEIVEQVLKQIIKSEIREQGLELDEGLDSDSIIRTLNNLEIEPEIEVKL